MEDIQELEKKVLEIVKKKHDETGGNNGNAFGDFDDFLNMSINERNVFLQNMVDRKLIAFRIGPNYNMIMLPK